MTYNYEHFDAFVESGEEREMFSAFMNLCHAGTRAPDGSMIRLDDRGDVRLSELWASRPVVLEFGSFT